MINYETGFIIIYVPKFIINKGLPLHRAGTAGEDEEDNYI